MATNYREATNKRREALGGRSNSYTEGTNKRNQALGSRGDLSTMSVDEARASITNELQSRGIAVDTLSRPADPRVDRGVEVVNNFQSRDVSPTLQSDISKALSTPAPERVTQTDTRDVLRETADEILGQDLGATRQQAREDAMVAEKEERARTLSNRLTERERQIQEQLEKLEANPQGKGDFALNADIARFNRESARELADLSFAYNVALGDYQAAEKLAQDYISDYQADLQNKQNAWQMLYTLTQNDMTESEKLQAQQAFEEKKMQDQFEMQQKMATFNSQLRREEQRLEFSMEQQAENQKNNMIASLFGGGIEGADTFEQDFDAYLSQIEEEQGMTLAPHAVAELRDDFLSQHAVSGNEAQRVAGMVATGILSPQQAEFLLTNLEIETPQVRAKQEAAIRRGKTVLRDVDRALQEVDKAGKAAGFFAEEGVLGIDRLSPAYELYQHLQSIKSNISIDELQAMREASPTGGALGQVPVQQQEFLMSVLGSLTPSLQPSVLEENLNDVYNIYLDAMYGSPQELQRAVKSGRMSVTEANSYLANRKQTSFNEFGIPARSGGQNITNLVISPTGDLVKITQ